MTARYARYAGFWRLPGLAERIPGHFSSSSGPDLHLTLLVPRESVQQLGLTLLAGPRFFPLISGRTVEAEAVTLLGCEIGSIRGGREVSELDLIARTALVGPEFETDHDIRFRWGTLKFSNLGNWCQISGFKRSGDTASPSIAFRAPAQLTASGSDWTISLWHAVQGSILPRQSAALEQASGLELTVAAPLSLEEWRRDFIQPLRHLITFGTGEAAHLTDVLFEKHAPRDDNDAMPAEVVLSGEQSDSPSAPRVPEEMVFCLPDIWNEFAAAIVSWVNFARPLDHVLSLLLSPDYRPNAGSRYHFLDLMNGLEAYHRARWPAGVLSEADHHVRLGRILAAAPTEERSWLEDRLRYSNEPSLRRRLKFLLTEAGEGLVGLADKSRFVERVLATRNYLVHNDQREAAGAASGESLEHLTMLLRVLVRGLLLRELGIAPERRLPILRRNFDWSLLAHRHETGARGY